MNAKKKNIGMDENIKVMITISPYDFKMLRNWAKLHGRTPSTYAAQIISSRIESNMDLINKQVQDYAAFKGMTVEELENFWSEDKDS